jgi:hypothetical protein
LGTPGRVHCLQYRAVVGALADHRRGWFTALLVPARHSLAALRTRSAVAVARRVWAPATVATA